MKRNLPLKSKNRRPSGRGSRPANTDTLGLLMTLGFKSVGSGVGRWSNGAGVEIYECGGEYPYALVRDGVITRYPALIAVYQELARDADKPVKKLKRKYSRSRWQIDAHGFTRSNGNRMLTPEELQWLPHAAIFKLFREFSLNTVYDFEHHVHLGEALELYSVQKGLCACDPPEKCRHGRLPVTFMLLQPPSWHPDVWTDITRMMTLNAAQSAKGREMHLCPLQFDLADRLIAQYSEEGETILDPFGGLMTVPYRALKLKRRAIGIELNLSYLLDGAKYCEAAAREVDMPTLFDLGGPEDAETTETVE